MNKTTRFIFASSIDAISAVIAFWGAYWLRLEKIPEELLLNTIIVSSTTVASFWILGVYKRIWRYASSNDLIVILKATLLSVAASAFIIFLMSRLEEIPRSTIIIYWILLAAFSGGNRVVYRLIRDRTLSPIYNKNERIGILLIGANDEAEAFIRATNKPDGPYHVIGILDNDKEKWGRTIREINVLGPIKDLAEIKKRKSMTQSKLTKVIIADRNIIREEIDNLLKISNNLGLTLARIPKLSELDTTNTEPASRTKPVEIEDLLGRPETRLDKTNLKKLIYKKTVLVTGAGGTIGSELCKQISEMQPNNLILSDFSEFALWNITESITGKSSAKNISSVLLDVRDQNAVVKLFKSYKPNIILHAAALKHVPICENHPIEAIRTNTVGTKIIADTCKNFDAEAMVLISTDKAVEPSSFMGASKRAAEIYIQSLDKQIKSTSFITVRFGNVLGSTGSVVPLFQNQIERGGALTVTDKKTTRFFMSVKEAVELVLISLVQVIEKKEKGGISVLKMGKPVNIDNLARQMIRLSGLTPGKDTKIIYTGLRTGEKLHEKLFYDDEKQIKTDHPDIIIAKGRELNFLKIKKTLDQIEQNILKNQFAETINILKELIPEFVVDQNNKVEKNEHKFNEN